MFCKALEGSAEIRSILFVQTTRSKEVWIEEIVELKSWTLKTTFLLLAEQFLKLPSRGAGQTWVVGESAWLNTVALPAC